MSAAVARAEVLSVARYQLMLGEVRLGSLDASSGLETPSHTEDMAIFDTSEDLLPE